MFAVSLLVSPTAPATTRRFHPLLGRGEGGCDEEGAFLMPVEDVFSISGRGTVVTDLDRGGASKRAAEIVAEMVSAAGHRR